MFWFVVVLIVFAAVFGTAIYRIDKNAKSRHQKSFNPNEWQLPGHIELPASVDSPLKSQLQVQSPVPTVKVTYETKPSIYPHAQYTFYKALEAALSGEFSLLTNINATDILAVVVSNALATQVALNNLTAKQFAFVVCDKATLKVLCVVDWGNTMDAQLKSACESAQLPLVTFNSQAEYDSQLLRAKIVNAIGLKASPASSSNESALDSAEEKPVTDVNHNGIDLVLCPECSAVMLKRKAKTGVNAGKLFWICSTYPECRGMRAIK